MSELLRRAAELSAAEQGARRQEAAEQAAQALHADRRRAELSRLGMERAKDFVRIMQSHQIPTKPIYVHIYRYVPGVLRDTSELVRVPKLGDGWLVRPYQYRYDEEPIRGLLLTDDYKLYECREVQHPFPNSTAARFNIQAPDYYDAGMRYEQDTGTLDRLPLLGEDNGMDVLARGLVINGVTG